MEYAEGGSLYNGEFTSCARELQFYVSIDGICLNQHWGRDPMCGHMEFKWSSMKCLVIEKKKELLIKDIFLLFFFFTNYD